MNLDIGPIFRSKSDDHGLGVLGRRDRHEGQALHPFLLNKHGSGFARSFPRVSCSEKQISAISEKSLVSACFAPKSKRHTGC